MLSTKKLFFATLFGSVIAALAVPALAQDKAKTETSTITTFFSETISSGSGPRVQGSGNLIEQPRQLGSFRAVRLDGPIDVKLRAGQSESVVVRADDNLAQMIETSVENGVLIVNLKKNASFRTKSPFQVVATFKSLDSVAIKGSGDIHIDRVTGDKFEANISGSGDINVEQLQTASFAGSVAGSGDLKVSGAATRQVISVAGSGNVHAKRLAGKDVKVTVAGSGDVIVNAADTLNVTIAGSGDVAYLGNPSVTRSIAGSGAVSQAK
ncbi:MAG: head GIN domain-containing protein [Burkholderiaceae bacterium]